MTFAQISLGGLSVSIDTDANYPDAVDDVANRVKAMFGEALSLCEEHSIDPVDAVFVPDLDDDLDDEDDE